MLVSLQIMEWVKIWVLKSLKRVLMSPLNSSSRFVAEPSLAELLNFGVKQ